MSLPTISLSCCPCGHYCQAIFQLPLLEHQIVAKPSCNAGTPRSSADPVGSCIFDSSHAEEAT